MTMALCQDGHTTQATDFCDQCGLPVVEAAPADTPSAAEPAVSVCPNCGAARPAGALFCESCGYDYTTGALPESDLRTELGLPPLPGAAPADKPPADETALEVKNWTVYDPEIAGRIALDNISFSARKGEIVGFAGLMGAGRTELFLSMMGVSSL